MTKDEMEKIVELIGQRKTDVLVANNVSEGDAQYLWIDGIYNDIIEYIRVQFE